MAEGVRFRRGHAYKQVRPCMWEPLQPSSTWVISKCIRGVVCASDAMAFRAAHKLSSLMPVPTEEQSAVSFADGMVYIASTDIMVPAYSFNNSCWRYIDHPSTVAAQPTPAFSAFCEANQIPEPQIYSALGHLLHPPNSTQVLCIHVPQQHDTGLDVEELIRCVVPKMHWCYMTHPRCMLRQITCAHKSGKRVLVADVRGWHDVAVAKLLQAFHNHRHAKKLHAVVITSAGRPLPEGALHMVYVGVTCQPQAAKVMMQESAAIVINSNRHYMQDDPRHTPRQSEAELVAVAGAY